MPINLLLHWKFIIHQTKETFKIIFKAQELYMTLINNLKIITSFIISTSK